jgi:hypothetical protein
MHLAEPLSKGGISTLGDYPFQVVDQDVVISQSMVLGKFKMFKGKGGHRISKLLL